MSEQQEKQKFTNASDAAFPIPGMNMQGLGMSLRDYFAAKALSGISPGAETDIDPTSWRWDLIAEASYMAADAMMKAREQ